MSRNTLLMRIMITVLNQIDDDSLLGGIVVIWYFRDLNSKAVSLDPSYFLAAHFPARAYLLSTNWATASTAAEADAGKETILCESEPGWNAVEWTTIIFRNVSRSSVVRGKKVRADRVLVCLYFKSHSDSSPSNKYELTSLVCALSLARVPVPRIQFNHIG